MIKILFVCLGNICRSPLAEGNFKEISKNLGLESSFLVDSCGTAGYHIGENPDYRSMALAEEKGFKLIHKGRKIDPDDFMTFDFIFAMDDQNYSDLKSVQKRVPNFKAQLLKYRRFDNKASEEDIPDPYYGSKKDFELVYSLSNECALNFIQFLKSTNRI